MEQRIKELLDDAAAGVTPADPDPLAAITRRSRSARRRTLAAGAAATVLLIAAGTAAFSQVTGTGPAPVAAPAPQGPRLAGGVVVAGAIELPVPAGWQVLTNDPARPCGDLADTILLVTTNDRGCQNAPVEISTTVSSAPTGLVLLSPLGDDPADALVATPAMITLAGGEPAWLSQALGSPDMRPGRYPAANYYDELVLPWSKVLIQLRLDGERARPILASIRSTPTSGMHLIVPEVAATAELTVPDAKGTITAAGHARTTDPATVAAVRDLLNQQGAVLDDVACASDDQPTARLILTPAEGAPTDVVIALGDCPEAVSSAGGRVRFTAASMAELKHLFGIGKR